MLLLLLFILSDVCQCNTLQNVNPIDGKQYRPILRMAREGFYNFIGSNSDDDYSFNVNLKNGVSLLYFLLFFRKFMILITHSYVRIIFITIIREDQIEF